MVAFSKLPTVLFVDISKYLKSCDATSLFSVMKDLIIFRKMLNMKIVNEKILEHPDVFNKIIEHFGQLHVFFVWI